MIRMIQSTLSGHAKAYFSEALAKADYYLDDQELRGHLRGKMAQRLGIDGIATKENFFALCENEVPGTGEPLTQRQQENRTVGYDINFHCPKSVSIVHALSKDDHMLKAFEASVQETMQDIEADALTRVRKGRKLEDRATSELAWAEFTHQTARPTEGHSPDPHLHAHCFVFNVTWDEEEKQRKAVQFRDIKRDMPYYQARFHKRLSDKLLDLGYQVRRTDKSFELEGVPQAVIDLFSKRTDEIGRVAEERGITDAKELAELGARTRSAKQKGLGMAELKADWRRQIRELELPDEGDGNGVVRYAPEPKKEHVTPSQCVNHALRHAFERASVVQDRRLLEAAYRHGIGHRTASLAEIGQDFTTHDELIHIQEKGRTLCTTQAVLKEEQKMVNLARRGKGRMVPIVRSGDLAAAPSDLEETGLDPKQAQAIENLLTSSDRVNIIRGVAGSGKTTMMREAVRRMAKAGKQTFVVAPSSEASRGVLRSEGFDNAETVAKLLMDRDLQERLSGQVLWVDEAGLLGTRDMTALLELAERQNARLILGGDTRQHSSVVRGDALRILNTVAQVPTAEMTTIYRQKQEAYRQVVQDLADGDVAKGFAGLESLDAIRTIDPAQPNAGLIEEYLEALREDKSALIVTPTHAQGEAVTAELRNRLREEGHIGKRELQVLRYQNLNRTEAEKADLQSYRPGQAVQMNQNLPGLKRGSIWRVEEVDDQVRLINALGVQHTLPLHRADAFELYEVGQIGLSKGDQVRITRNGFDKNERRLNNGDVLEVVSAHKKGPITLRNARSNAHYQVDQDFGHLSHAACVTSHAAQGKTVDRVFISQPSGTFPATDAKQFYVSVSRGRELCRIYTDDQEALREHAQRMGDRTSALELVEGHDRTGPAVERQIHEEILRGSTFEPKAPQPTRELLPNIPQRDRDYEPGL